LFTPVPELVRPLQISRSFTFLAGGIAEREGNHIPSRSIEWEKALARFSLGVKQANKLSQLDAEMLVEVHGPRAYEEARSRARIERLNGPELEMPKGHWDRVRKIIAQRINRKFVGTSARHLEH
jgi:hypothetical protein